MYQQCWLVASQQPALVSALPKFPPKSDTAAEMQGAIGSGILLQCHQQREGPSILKERNQIECKRFAFFSICSKPKRKEHFPIACVYYLIYQLNAIEHETYRSANTSELKNELQQIFKHCWNRQPPFFPSVPAIKHKLLPIISHWSSWNITNQHLTFEQLFLKHPINIDYSFPLISIINHSSSTKMVACLGGWFGLHGDGLRLTGSL